MAATTDDALNGDGGPAPFVAFARSVQPQSVLRAQVSAVARRPETELLPLLLEEAALPAEAAARVEALARGLVEALRRKGKRGAVEELIQEYALSSQEGIALMCLAEALLRIPDRATRDALIREKIGQGDWQAHLGASKSLFVNAATWGLLITGRLVATTSEASLAAALVRLVGRGGEPLIRRGVDVAMRMLGQQFVAGQTIGEALANTRRLQARGFTYSFDMLGEAAMTASDAARYLADYEQAIQVVGRAGAGLGPVAGPGVSVKLSALHPRYGRAQRERVMTELLGVLRHLCGLAREAGIGLSIDAEEADRLDISLDLLEALALDSTLGGWDGLGFVVQAYLKRAPFVIDGLIETARRSLHRLMVRLVKGAYWDSEIKAAQVAGLEGFPVFTRKVHTDVCYLACSRRLLTAGEAVYPQFATHNAQTLASLLVMAGEHFHPGRYEFQCLHGMGEPLYEEVVGPEKLGRPCRIYAPVGSHETLLAYLVRRLLENGANSSFVNRVGDEAVTVDELVADPVAEARRLVPLGAPHPRIAAPSALFGAARANSMGIDLANEQRLASLAASLLAGAATPRHAAPMLGDGEAEGPAREVRNPADKRDLVGHVVEAAPEQVAAALAQAAAAAPAWEATPPGVRAACLERAADAMEAQIPALIGLLVREAGKTLPNALGEVREAVDFLRYYSAEVKQDAGQGGRPLGVVACISPWNFPLSIFIGQISAALAAGNTVLAKPASATPLVAALAVGMLRAAGVPPAALQLLPCDGAVGARLVADARVGGVVFTGSTEVARLIARSLAARQSPDGRPVPLIAETGGQNAMVVDSSALAEQVVADVLASAFDSAGQRCSALRVLCLQEEVAGRMLDMLKGAMAELSVGNPDRLSTDVGPVISAPAREAILAHVEAMRARGFAVHAPALPQACARGSFVAPTLIELDSIATLAGEVFGPVLHVVRWQRRRLDELIDAINATGYGLTFGVHSRIQETVARTTARVAAGNCYVNRNMIGAVVGVQPFGGHRLSGTGPKAGGPLYLSRLRTGRPAPAWRGSAPAAAGLWAEWLAARGEAEAASRCRALAAASPLGAECELPGPVGERNTWSLEPRGDVQCLPASMLGLALQVAAALATGNRALVTLPDGLRGALGDLPEGLRGLVTEDAVAAGAAAVLHEGDADALRDVAIALAGREGNLVMLHGATSEGLQDGSESYPLEWLVQERSVSVDTAAAGGNAQLMTLE